MQSSSSQSRVVRHGLNSQCVRVTSNHRLKQGQMSESDEDLPTVNLLFTSLCVHICRISRCKKCSVNSWFVFAASRRRKPYSAAYDNCATIKEKENLLKDMDQRKGDPPSPICVVRRAIPLSIPFTVLSSSVRRPGPYITIIVAHLTALMGTKHLYGLVLKLILSLLILLAETSSLLLV